MKYFKHVDSYANKLSMQHNCLSLSLPCGRIYQKGGARLEQALYNCMPKTIKKHTIKNFKPKNKNGNIIVEYDILYIDNDEIVSFEIKGINNKTSSCYKRQRRLINQAIKQQKYLENLYSTLYNKIKVVMCLVTGLINEPIDQEFLNELTNNNIIVSIGQKPNDSLKNAILLLKKEGFLVKC